jgi:hypothetical protein
MNTTITRTLRTGSALVVTLLAALSVQAADAGEQTYKRVVLGNTSIAAPQATEAAVRIVPGSYARYLIKNGMDSQQALVTARATGETATIERAEQRMASDELTGRQLYDRVMGIAG